MLFYLSFSFSIIASTSLVVDECIIIFILFLLFTHFSHRFMTLHFDDRNVNTFRVFANETSQFLAPYEASVKPRTENASPPEVSPDVKPALGTSASHVRIVSS